MTKPTKWHVRPAKTQISIERKYRWMTFIGMLFHSCTNVCWNWRNACGCTGGWRTRLSSRSHTCSIGDKSEDFKGHSITFTLFCRILYPGLRAQWIATNHDNGVYGHKDHCVESENPKFRIHITTGSKVTAENLLALAVWASIYNLTSKRKF